MNKGGGGGKDKLGYTERGWIGRWVLLIQDRLTVFKTLKHHTEVN